MSSAVRAVVAGHGGFADGVVSAVDQITGRGDLFARISNRDLGATEIEAALRAWAEQGVHVFFTDLPAGSVTIAARRVLRDHPEITVVTGASVATLLDFAFAADAGAAAAAAAAEKGRQALVACGAAAPAVASPAAGAPRAD